MRRLPKLDDFLGLVSDSHFLLFCFCFDSRSLDEKKGWWRFVSGSFDEDL